MSNDILVITEHMDGKVADISYELVGKAKQLAVALGGRVVALMFGSGVAHLAATFTSDTTLYVDDPALAEFNPEAYGKLIEALITEYSPRVTLVGSTSIGMDLAAWLSARAGQPCIAYANRLAVEGGALVTTSQIYGGKVAAETTPVGESAIVSVVAGAFPAAAGRGTTAAEQIRAPIVLNDLRTRFTRLIRPAAGDIDITTYDKLVSVGRGIGGKENIELAQELADALGAALAGSRPITDAGWLPKTRQVGKSGLAVKPKLYLMLGV